MKLTLPFDRLTPLFKRMRFSAARIHFPAAVRLLSYLKRRFPGVFYDPSRHYMRGPGPKASSKQKSSTIDSKTT